MPKDMSKRSQTNYPAEFKSSSIKLAIESDQPVAKTARDLGVNVNTLYSWIYSQSQQNNSNNNMMKNSECHFDEMRKLKKELAIVTKERDLLKKGSRVLCQRIPVK